MQLRLNQKIIDENPAGIFVYQDNSFIYKNARFLEIWQNENNHLNLQTIFNQIHEQDRGQIRKLFNSLSNNSKESLNPNLTIRKVGARGKIIRINMLTEIITFQGTSSLLGLLIKEADIRQENDEFAKLENIKREIESKRKLIELGKLSGNIAHEIKNPLTIIDGSIRFITRNIENPSQNIKDHIKKIRYSVKRTNHIINSLLNIKGLDKTDFDKLEVNSFLKRVLKRISFPTEIKVEKNITNNIIYISGNYHLLEIAIQNIISNAIEAMNGSGVFTIELKQTNNKNVKFAFQDTGEGIARHNFDRVFKPLYTTKNEGNGFGLHIVKKIVEAHKGRIKLESIPGQGTKFTLIFPGQ